MIGTKGTQAVRVKLVDVTGAGRPVHHEPGVLEHLEVLRDGGAADRKIPCELADRLWTIRESLEDRPTGRVAECRPDISWVSQHLR